MKTEQMIVSLHQVGGCPVRSLSCVVTGEGQHRSSVTDREADDLCMHKFDGGVPRFRGK
jgi:hypothetical protein